MKLLRARIRSFGDDWIEVSIPRGCEHDGRRDGRFTLHFSNIEPRKLSRQTIDVYMNRYRFWRISRETEAERNPDGPVAFAERLRWRIHDGER